MATRLSKAAKKVTAVAFWAVFFSGTVSGADTSLSRLESGLNELIYQLSRSVVTIESSTPVSPKAFQGQGDEAVQSLISSGIIYDLLGHILVAAPAVIGRERIVVRFGDEVIPARLRGIDHQTGLAVIHVNRRIGVPASFSSREGCAGQMVIAMGNSYGVPACPSLGFCAGFRPDGTIQFSSPITSGTVGGGVFDLSGNLVGLITGGIALERRLEAGLAIPAHKIPGIVRQILMQGDRPVGYIGITTADIEISPGIKLKPVNLLVNAGISTSRVIERGVMVTAVVPSSPAAQAGLRKGDLLLSMNDSPLRSALDLRNRVRQTFPGTVVKLGFIRNDSPYRVHVEIGKLLFDSSQAYLAQPAAEYPHYLLQDSLRIEIESLKKALHQLEKQLIHRK
jgi:S1-C subfamily serine protease